MHDTGDTYDFIIAGAGCAGLSLAMHLIDSGSFVDKKILIVDKDAKQSNDRTWCFWEKEQGLFEPIVFRRWDALYFYSDDVSRRLSLSPYQYKMVRGIDFYDHCLEKIRTQANFVFLQEEVQELFSDVSGTGVMAGGKEIRAGYVFNSILFGKPQLKKGQYWMLQHFKGWIVETPHDVFDPQSGTLMDFRIPQQQGTAFCYVLPLSARRALVEYTLFSRSLLPKEQYDEGLRAYIQDVLGIHSYTVTEEEFGIIPMTNFPFKKQEGNVIHIGTAGGQTKASSGYTFNFIQKHSRQLVQALKEHGKPFLAAPQKKFSFYDGVLLNILDSGSMEGKKIFSDLFRKNAVPTVLKFLDNETSLAEDMEVIFSLPVAPFLKAAIKQVL